MTDSAGDLPRAARALTLAARALERAAAASELTLAQFRILVLIAAGDERSTLLADRLAVAKPTITAVVDGLVERGFVAREAVAGDRRSIRVVLTPAGDVRVADRRGGDVGDARPDLRVTRATATRCVGALHDLDDALALRMQARIRGEQTNEVPR